jgi:hypothetical protein
MSSFVEDAAEVFHERRLADTEVAGDLGIGAPSGDMAEHVVRRADTVVGRR